MSERLVVVLDVGKTLAKASLWTTAGELVGREARPNARCGGPDYPALDVGGIEAWLGEVLAKFARLGDVGAIIPVGHGAAAAIVRDGALAAPPMDYEYDPPPGVRAAYFATCDAFSETGSPRMGMALNLGLQLHCIERFHPGLLADGSAILPWAQYWAWRLSGVAASEVTSLGSHTDLWAPARNAPSSLAVRRGWAALLAPRRHAREALGPLLPDWVRRTGLKPDVVVHVGLHDSNAALYGARGDSAFAAGDATLVSTGTWFVSMRSLCPGSQPPSLPENRGCLLNVDTEGRPAPTALFMGGRETELLGAVGLDQPDRQGDLIAALAPCVARGAMVAPTMAPGTGFFPTAPGGWLNKPDNLIQTEAAVALYVAQMIDVGLDLIGSRDAVLIEGRFARSRAITEALARLRPNTRVFVSGAESDVSLGALRLVLPDVVAAPLLPVEPVNLDLAPYRAEWRRLVKA